MKLEKDNLKCYCGGSATPSEIRMEGLKLRGWKCKECGETYLHPDDSMRISAIRKLKSKPFEATVAKAGNSFAIRIQKEAAVALALKIGEKIKFTIEGPKNANISTL
ncbi:hypothetical protein HY989_06230 [Candidatus Micrarchaeota archaeon]|nr:hypothetical protein [Candidatus Micrarchaeota archaeon]